MKRLSGHINRIKNEIQNLRTELDGHALYTPASYILGLGGKRLRPAMVCMAADLFGRQDSQVDQIALAVEVFHNFSLVHDDIMDEAPLRRGKETVHTKWNSNQAILSGDAMLVLAYRCLLKGSGKNIKDLHETFDKVALEVCEGQQLDMDFEERDDVHVDEYLEMIRLKTSVLLGAALKLGAISADASIDDRNAIYAFGENLGLAFQLHDDLLDAFGDPEKVGKQVGGDIMANKKTFLLIRLMEKASAEDKVELERLMALNGSDKVEGIKAFMLKYEVDKELSSRCDAYHEEALKHLHSINGGPEVMAELEGFAMQIMQREH